MPWVMLVVAGLLEVGWVVALKLSGGFSKPLPSTLFVVGLAGSMALLGAATRTLPIGTAYAIWVGIGAAGTAVLGMAVLGDPVSAARIALLGLLVVSVVGLKVVA